MHSEICAEDWPIATWSDCGFGDVARVVSIRQASAVRYGLVSIGTHRAVGMFLIYGTGTKRLVAILSAAFCRVGLRPCTYCGMLVSLFRYSTPISYLRCFLCLLSEFIARVTHASFSKTKFRHLLRSLLIAIFIKVQLYRKYWV